MKKNNSILLNLYIFITFMSSIFIAVLDRSYIWFSILIVLQFVVYLIIYQLLQKKYKYFIHLSITLLIIIIILLIKFKPSFILSIITINDKLSKEDLVIIIYSTLWTIVSLVFIISSIVFFIDFIKNSKIIRVEVTDYDYVEKFNKGFYIPIYKYVYNNNYIEKKGKIIFTENIKKNLYILINKNNSLLLNKRDYINILFNVIKLVSSIVIISFIVMGISKL